jgi:EF hand
MAGFAHSDTRSGALSASMSAASTAAAAAAAAGRGAAQGNRLSSGHAAPSHSFSMQRRGSVIGGSVAQRSKSNTSSTSNTATAATAASGTAAGVNGRQRSLRNSLQEGEEGEERSLQELYVRLHPIKWVTPEDLHGQFGSSSGSGSSGSGSRGKTGVSRVGEWFTFFDKDGDGKISSHEFAQTLRELQVQLLL